MSTAARAFEAAYARRDHSAEPAFLRQARERGMAGFAEAGIPTPRLEDWKYTNLSELADTAFEDAADAPAVTRAWLESRVAPVFACSLRVMLNGRPERSLWAPGGDTPPLSITSLREALERDPELLEAHLGQVADGRGHALSALNTALFEDGVVVHVAAGAEIAEPIHLVSVASAQAAPTATHPRLLIVAERGSRVVLIEDCVSSGTAPTFTNAVTEVVVGENARVDLVRIQSEGAAASQVSRLAVRQARDSRFTSHALCMGGGLLRNDVDALLADEGADCSLQGLFLAAEGEHVDNHTVVDHASPHCDSRELYKGILAGRSRGIFNGRVVVREGAQHTDAQQQNKNLLLSDRARVDTKPQLEIYADDVKCSHGSTIGQLDEDALFYLRARGIAAPQARVLLTRAFASEILEGLPVAPLRDRIGELLAARALPGEGIQ